MKKFLSVLLCAVMLFSSFSAVIYAFDGSREVPCTVKYFDRIFGSLGCFFGKLFDFINDDEPQTREPESPSYISFDGKLFDGEGRISLEAETWKMVEITLESEKSYASPFDDAELSLDLAGCGVKYTVPGFWNGGNEWKVRFVCPAEGEWSFITSCTDKENTALDGVTGKVNCRKYSGNLDIYKHGFVTAKEGRKYFTYDDGTPFVYLGDTHWSLGDETVDMVAVISEKRAAQGFSVIQSEPIGAKFELTDGVSEADMAGFADYDAKFALIAENGLVHANSQFFFPASMETLIDRMGGYSEKTVSETVKGKTETAHDLSDSVKLYLEKLTRYWVARYGAYPVLWTLGQEVDNDFYRTDDSHPDWSYVNNPYKLVAEYIAKYDAYSHPVSAHQEYSGATSAYGYGNEEGLKVYKKEAMPSAFRNVPAHNWYAVQWSPNKTGRSDCKTEKDYWFNSQGKPAINYEGAYCYLWTKNFGSRMQGWVSYLSGMYGYGWGGHDTWSYTNIYDEENDSSDGIDTITSAEKKAATWQDSLEYPSSYQSGYMASFMKNIAWQTLIPRFDSKKYFVPSKDVYYCMASNEDNSLAVIYFYSFSDLSVGAKPNAKSEYAGVLTGTVGGLEPGAVYKYKWFDPVNGEYSGESEFTASSIGTYYIGERNMNGKTVCTDMVLLIYK